MLPLSHVFGLIRGTMSVLFTGGLWVSGAEWEEVENYFKDVLAQVNATLPSTHRIAKLTVRKEDFKRTGTLKVSRN